MKKSTNPRLSDPVDAKTTSWIDGVSVFLQDGMMFLAVSLPSGEVHVAEIGPEHALLLINALHSGAQELSAAPIDTDASEAN